MPLFLYTARCHPSCQCSLASFFSSNCFNVSELITSTAGAVAKYYNEQRICVCVCVCVCLSASISPKPHARSLPSFRACCLSPWLCPPPAVWRNPKGKGHFCFFFFPIDNALYSVAFGTHTKTAEPIQMSFGLMTRVGLRYHVLDGVQIPKGKGQFSGVVRAIQKHWQSSLQPSLQRRCRVRCDMDHSIVNNVMQQKGSFWLLG